MLDKQTLKAGIQALHNELFVNADNLTPVQAGERYATALSDLMDQFVKSGSLNVPGTGLLVGSTAVTGASITGTIQ